MRSIQIPLKYFGAEATGRWSGTGGRNYQNLPSPSSTARLGLPDVRSFLRPQPGHVFLISDYNQIEPRLLLWQVGDTYQLDLIRQGMSIYEVHARATMGWKGGVLKEENKDLYALAKARVLSCGYGTGAEKFRTTSGESGIIMTPEEARHHVDAYRESNRLVVESWEYEDTRLELAVKNRDAFFPIDLASGRTIYYHFPKYCWESYDVLDPKTGEKKRKTRKCVKAYLTQRGLAKHRRILYGAKCIQAKTQGNARDVLGGAILRLWDDPRFRLVFHVHDEVITEVPEKHAEKLAPELQKIMKNVQPYFDGLPVDAGVTITDHYMKD